MQDTLHRVLDDRSPLDAVRAFAADPERRADVIWRELTELGVPGLLVDEEHGGSGLGMVDAALVAQTLGAHVAPVPYIVTTVLAPLALNRAGTQVQRDEWLPRIAKGETLIGLAISEHTGAREDAAVEATGHVLNGRALFVFDFDADAFLVASRDGALFLVDAMSAGLSRAELVTIDRTRRIGELTFDKVSADRLDGGDESKVLQSIIDHGRVMLAADTLGAAQHMLTAAVDYAGQREQFGRVIGSFQAVKHLCADMAASLEPCHALVWYAAHALESLSDEAHLYACHTKAHLSEVGTAVAKTATEVHGGVGFTDLLGLHYWFKRIGLNRQLLGGPERARHEAALAQQLVPG